MPTYGPPDHNLILRDVNTEKATAAARPSASGFVLAGGRSSRMGQDKAQVLFGGQPLALRALLIFRQAGLSASLAGGSASLAAFAPVVEDSKPGLGPLGGICAALRSTSARWAVFLPVDLPLLPAPLVKFLLDHARMTGRAVTLCSINGFAQTFPAVVDRAALPSLETELAAGRAGCFSAFQAAAAGLSQPVTVLAVESLVQTGQVAHADGLPAARWFMNVNASDDLSRAKACLSRA
jgi:molybdopterin-guanine dinucleotide biosynthesis protein A